MPQPNRYSIAFKRAVMGGRRGQRSCAPAHRTGEGLGSIRTSPAVVPPGWPPCHDSDDTAPSRRFFFGVLRKGGSLHSPRIIRRGLIFVVPITVPSLPGRHKQDQGTSSDGCTRKSKEDP